MEIQKSSTSGAEILRITGEVDLHASPTLRAHLQALASQKTPALLVDFSDVDYIDSSGLATLVEFVRLMEPYGGKLALFGLKPKVRAIFDLVRLDELFTIAATEQEARKALGL